MSDWTCADALLNWLNTQDADTLRKTDIYAWVMEWRPHTATTNPQLSAAVERVTLLASWMDGAVSAKDLTVNGRSSASDLRLILAALSPPEPIQAQDALAGTQPLGAQVGPAASAPEPIPEGDFGDEPWRALLAPLGGGIVLTAALHKAATLTWGGAAIAYSVLTLLEEIWPHIDRAALAALSKPLPPAPIPVGEREALSTYDAGLLNDFGGGNVEWWQDYIRAELGRAQDHYEAQASDLLSKVAELEGELARLTRLLAEAHEDAEAAELRQRKRAIAAETALNTAKEENERLREAAEIGLAYIVSANERHVDRQGVSDQNLDNIANRIRALSTDRGGE